MDLLAIITPFLIGSAIIVILFPKDSLKKIGFALTVCLGTGLVLGITSSLAFQWLAYYGQLTSGYFIGEFGLALFLVFFSCYRFLSLKDTQTDSILRSNTEYITIRWLKIFFYLLLAVSVAYYVLKIFGDSPHGKWDAWAIWNFRARWLFRGEAQWTYAFSNYVLDSHPDYPLLLPVSVFRIWISLGKDIVAIPILIAGFYTFGSILLILSSIAIFRGQTQGYLAGIVMLMATNFLKNGTYQYGDIPLAFYILSTVILFNIKDCSPNASSRIMYLAGLTASGATWTKNEGLLFLIVILLVHVIGDSIMNDWRRSLKDYFCFLLGLIPILSSLIFFKLKFAPANDMVNLDSLSSIWNKLLQFDRYQQILIAFAKKIFLFNDGLNLLLVVYLLISGLDKTYFKQRRFFAQTSLLVLLLGGYFFTYVIFSYNDLAALEWHLKTSLDRLIIQIWPFWVFLLFYCVKGPEKS
jgi:hypothetical protein